MTPTPLPSPANWGEIITAIPVETAAHPVMGAALAFVVVVSLSMFMVRKFRGAIR